jgi:hypothetical protein
MNIEGQLPKKGSIRKFDNRGSPTDITPLPTNKSIRLQVQIPEMAAMDEEGSDDEFKEA